MPLPVCVDASLTVKLVLVEPYSEEARSLWAEWERQGVERVVPTLWGYEVASVIRKHGQRGTVSPEDEEAALGLLLNLPLLPTLISGTLINRTAKPDPDD